MYPTQLLPSLITRNLRHFTPVVLLVSGVFKYQCAFSSASDFYENMELRQRFDDRVDYKMLNNCSSLNLDAHVKRRNRAKHETFSVLEFND